MCLQKGMEVKNKNERKGEDNYANRNNERNV